MPERPALPCAESEHGRPRVYSRRKGAEKPPPGEVIARFRRWFLASPGMVAGCKGDLRGKDLVCWCAPLPCHADVLLEVANS